MLTTNELQYSVPTLISPSLEDLHEISRLMAAAVVNPSFRDLLLVDPQQAIENGYQGETFLLSDAARYLLLYVHADTLPDLAGQIAQNLGMSLSGPTPVCTRAPVLIGF